ncbi:MAG TPA: SDR family NAD(P)-dependent oxidoreductase [Dehalococcoidia bacterium]|nr:SDR family NAD(P)-dependent oxidoreductase [Dehalococcoidia bacterium]HLB29520.1 SDR family NAD(P)-dependent oxidoreductase [Dehalococcoidia bacterium]
MDLQLAGKTAIVTGGGSNIGRGISLGLAKEGANVVIADVDETAAKKVADQANALEAGGKTIAIRCDVTNYQNVEAMINQAVQQFGQVHALVNNVGWTVDQLFIERSRQDWEKEVNLNLWSVINCCRAMLPHMIEKSYGHIVSIGSDAGRMGEYREAVYSGCKAGVIGLTKALAREVGRYGITLNVVCPGTTPPGSVDELSEVSAWRGEMGQMFMNPEIQKKAAERYPLRRLGTPGDIASAVAFLASDAARHITGQTLSVSGGYSMM